MGLSSLSPLTCLCRFHSPMAGGLTLASPPCRPVTTSPTRAGRPSSPGALAARLGTPDTLEARESAESTDAWGRSRTWQHAMATPRLVHLLQGGNDGVLLGGPVLGGGGRANEQPVAVLPRHDLTKEPGGRGRRIKGRYLVASVRPMVLQASSLPVAGLPASRPFYRRVHVSIIKVANL